jgi:hypothetical protein
MPGIGQVQGQKIMLGSLLWGSFLIVVVIAWHFWCIQALYRIMPDNKAHNHFLRSVGPVPSFSHSPGGNSVVFRRFLFRE